MHEALTAPAAVCIHPADVKFQKKRIEQGHSTLLKSDNGMGTSKVTSWICLKGRHFDSKLLNLIPLKLNTCY